MNEDYATYEQAKVLKELGFDWKCYTFYHEDNWCGLSDSGMCENHNMFDKCISAPTLAQTQQWLFEKCDVWVEITLLDFPNNFGYELKYDYYPKEKYCCQGYKTPKEALSKCIDKALEILKAK